MVATRGHIRGRSFVAGICIATAGVVATNASAHASARADAGEARLTPAQINHILRPAPKTQMLPTTDLARRIRLSAGPNAAGDMTYHGGPVMQQANNSVLIFWTPPTVQDGTDATPDPNYGALIERYFDDIGGSPLNQVATQYYQTVNGPTEYIVNASNRLSVIVDTTPYPKNTGFDCNGNGTNCLDDFAIRDKVRQVLQNNPSLPQDLNTEYYVFLAPHESECFDQVQCFKSDTGTNTHFKYCAYHSSLFNGDNEIVYATMPYVAYTAPGINSCSTLSSFPNNRDADIAISIISHEQIESTTDPYADAWYYSDLTGEIGDLCAYDYGPRNLDGGLANEQWNGHYYLVQQEWSNADHACVQGLNNPPANDNVEGSIILPHAADASGTTTGTNENATRQPNEPLPVSTGGGHTIWYAIIPSKSGQLRVDTCGSDFDTMIAMYDGNYPTAQTKIAKNDDSCGHQSALQIPVSAGIGYWIQVDGYGGQTGTVKLNWWLAHNDRIVSVAWSSAENARLAKMGKALGHIAAAKVQKTATYIISYVLASVPPKPTPVTVNELTNGVTYTDFWTPSEFPVLDRVKNKYVLTDSKAVRFSTKIVDYLLALGGH